MAIRAPLPLVPHWLRLACCALLLCCAGVVGNMRKAGRVDGSFEEFWQELPVRSGQPLRSPSGLPPTAAAGIVSLEFCNRFQEKPEIQCLSNTHILKTPSFTHFSFNFMCVLFACECTTRVLCQKRGYWIPWDWSYRCGCGNQTLVL